MPHYDCQLDHHAEIRIEAANPTEAKAEYFRLYAITGSTAAFHCDEAAPGSAEPIEPDAWVARRKELGTFEAVKEPVKAAMQEPATDSPPAKLPPTRAEEAQDSQASQAAT